MLTTRTCGTVSTAPAAALALARRARQRRRFAVLHDHGARAEGGGRTIRRADILRISDAVENQHRAAVNRSAGLV